MPRLFLLLCLTSVTASAAALDFISELGNIYPTMVATGGDGSIWVAGYLYQGGPLRTTPDAFQPRPPQDRCPPGGPRGPRIPCPIGFLAQLDGEGGLLYSTYLGGGDGYDAPIRGLTSDAEGHAYVSGRVGTLKLNPSGERMEWLLEDGGYELLTLAPDGGVVGVSRAGADAQWIGTPDAESSPLLRYESGDGWTAAGGGVLDGSTGWPATSEDGTLLAWVDGRALWSRDFGYVWQPSTNPLTTVGEDEFVATALHPVDSNVALIGAAKGRLFRTEDGGASWTASTGLPDSFETQQILLAGGNSRRAFVAGFHHIQDRRNPLYFRSADGGASWTPMENPESAGTPPISYFSALAVDPASPDTLFAIAELQVPSDQPHNAVLRSDDAGRSWTLVRSDLRWASAIAIDPADSKVVYLIASRGIEISRNRGRTWSLAVPLELASEAKALATESSSETVFASTEHGLYRSADQGRTWRLFQAQPPGGFYHLLTAPGVQAGHARLLGWAAYSAYSSRNAVTKLAADGSGVEWSIAVGGSGPDWIEGMAVDDAGDIWLAGHTRSVDFPTAGAHPAAYPGGPTSAFLAKLDPVTEQLEYSTTFGGTGPDSARAIFVDPSGEVLAVGDTSSPDFPFTHAWTDGQANESRRFLARFDPTMMQLSAVESPLLPAGPVLRDSQGRFVSAGPPIVRLGSDGLPEPEIELQGGQVQGAALDGGDRLILAVTA